MTWTRKEEGEYRVEMMFVNVNKGYGYGDAVEYIQAGSIAELRQKLREEYGTVFEPMYIDTRSGETIQTGWVIRGRTRYDDTRKTYIREVWATVGVEEVDDETGAERYAVGVKKAKNYRYPRLRRSA